MQHHIGRAGRVGTRVIADDGVESEQRLDQIVLEAIVQHFAGRTREQIEQAAVLLQRKPAQDVRGSECIEGLTDRAGAEPLDNVGRRAQHELAQHVGNRLKFARERVDTIGIAFAELCNRSMSAAFACQQIAAVGGGQEILRAAFDDPQAVIMQFEI